MPLNVIRAPANNKAMPGRPLRPSFVRVETLSRPFQSTLEAGVNGVTVTTANSGGQVTGGYDDAWDRFSNNIPTFDNAHAHHGSLALKFTQPSGSVNANSAGWTRLANPPGLQSFGRIYIFITAAPSQPVQLIRYGDATGTLVGGVRLTTTPTLICLKASNGTVGVASATLPLNQWIRVETRCLPSVVSGVGEIECRAWWTDPESTGTPDYTANNVAVASLGGTTIERYEFGIAANPASFTVTWNLWADDIIGNATTWPGPAIVTGAIINIGISDNAFSSAGLFPSLTLQPSTSLFPASGGTGMSDSVGAVKIPGGATFSRTATDTGTTISDTVQVRDTRPISDTGLTVTDSVATIRVHLVSDTGTTNTDTVATNRARPLSDTGTTVTDSVATKRVRLVSDTGATVTDSVATARVHLVTDTATANTDTVRLTVNRLVADTGATISDSVVGGRGFARAVSDTGVTVTDSVATIRVHLVSDTGATITDTIATVRVHLVSDTGATISDGVVGGRGFARIASDTGATITDTVATVRVHRISDTGVTVTDSVSSRRVRVVSDTGVTISDSVVATRALHVSISDTGVTVSDSVFASAGLPPTQVVGLYGYVGNISWTGVVNVGASGVVKL